VILRGKDMDLQKFLGTPGVTEGRLRHVRDHGRPSGTGSREFRAHFISVAHVDLSA
jgi:hypothetical protein